MVAFAFLKDAPACHKGRCREAEVSEEVGKYSVQWAGSGLG